jgi:hypothetical protein
LNKDEDLKRKWKQSRSWFYNEMEKVNRRYFFFWLMLFFNAHHHFNPFFSSSSSLSTVSNVQYAKLQLLPGASEQRNIADVFPRAHTECSADVGKSHEDMSTNSQL